MAKLLTCVLLIAVVFLGNREHKNSFLYWYFHTCYSHVYNNYLMWILIYILTFFFVGCSWNNDPISKSGKDLLSNTYRNIVRSRQSWTKMLAILQAEIWTPSWCPMHWEYWRWGSFLCLQLSLLVTFSLSFFNKLNSSYMIFAIHGNLII